MTVLRTNAVAGAVVLGLLMSACSAGDRPSPWSSSTQPPSPSAVGLGPLPSEFEPSLAPVRAGSKLASARLPTNQWWTSVLTEEPHPVWAQPIVANVGPDGLSLGASADLAVTADTIAAAPAPQITVGGPIDGVAVVGHGDFSVELSLARPDADPVVATLAQGSPVVYLMVPEGRFTVVPAAAPTASSTADSGLSVEVAGRTWDLLAEPPIAWSSTDSRFVAEIGTPTSIAVAARPDGASAAWDNTVRAAARSPITTTTSTLTVDRERGVVRQELAWEREGRGVVALLPHHQAHAVGAAAGSPVLGTFASARGLIRVVAAASVTTETPLIEPPAAVAALELEPATEAHLVDELDRDLDASVVGAGIYDDGKQLGRLALLADIADRLDADDERARALDLLSASLTDWLTYAGPEDDRWLAYEPTWGGVVARPAQFGNEDYNDHHFQYAYLVRAAATLERLSEGRGLAANASDVVDLLVADVIGGSLSAADGFPPFRVWNAYLGHSAASGFATFADGNNQESSSEAVHAWEAIAAWARVRDDRALFDAAIARYAIEAASARRYWLGEVGERPPGYDHTVVGVLWDGKADHSTFFDGRTEAVIGIQLLPFTPGSAYRSDPEAARRRVATARSAGGGEPRLWLDLFVMEEAIADPEAALGRLDTLQSVEAGNSETWLRWWVLTRLGQAASGPDGQE